MIKHTIIPITILAAAICVLAGCQTTSQSTSQSRFERADANKDKKIDRTECSDFFITSLFESRDKNGDKNLTWEEWHVEGDGSSKERFAAADDNKDGSLALEEALADGRKRGAYRNAFQAADTSKDGFLTIEEVQAYYGSKEGRPN